MEFLPGSVWFEIGHNLTVYELQTLSMVGRYFRRKLWDNENYWQNRALTEGITDAPTSWKHYYASSDLLYLSDQTIGCLGISTPGQSINETISWHLTPVPFPEQISDIQGDREKTLFILSVLGNVYTYDSSLIKLALPETVQALAVWNNAALFLGRGGQIYGYYNQQVMLMDGSSSLRFTHLAMKNNITALFTVDHTLYVCKKNPRDHRFLQRYFKYAEPEAVWPPPNITQLLIVDHKVCALTSEHKLFQVFPGTVPKLLENEVIKYDNKHSLSTDGIVRWKDIYGTTIYNRQAAKDFVYDSTFNRAAIIDLSGKVMLSSGWHDPSPYPSSWVGGISINLPARAKNVYTHALVCNSNVCVTSWRHVAQLIGQRKLKPFYVESLEVEPYRGTFEISDNAGTIFRFDAIYTPRQGTFSAIE